MQPTTPAQHASPIPPHADPVPGTHAPAVQVPSPPPQAAPAASHVFVLWSQHPPALQVLSSQHGWPVPPHAVQFAPAALHVRPEAVQKFAAEPFLLGLPGQQLIPAVPHGLTEPVPVPPVHELTGEPPAFLHVPRIVSPHELPAAMHSPSTQQSPAVVQSFSAQHGSPVAPHTSLTPSSQT